MQISLLHLALWILVRVISCLKPGLEYALKILGLCFHQILWCVYRFSIGIYLDLSKGYGHSQSEPSFSAPKYDPSVQYLREECFRLRQDKEQLTTLVQTLK